MIEQEFFKIVDYITDKGWELVHKYIKEDLPIDIVDIFARDKNEYDELNKIMEELGEIVGRPLTGLIYKLKESYKTEYGQLYLIKVRKPDPDKPQRGAPDFRVADYQEFKSKYKDLKNMKLIVRPEYEMLELSDPDFDVFVYFLNRPLTTDLGIQ